MPVSADSQLERGTPSFPPQLEICCLMLCLCRLELSKLCKKKTNMLKYAETRNITFATTACTRNQENFITYRKEWCKVKS